MCQVDWTAISIIFATLGGPILAVWASEWRQQKRQVRDRQEWVFRTLMTTRSNPLHPDHVTALNHIDIVFPQNNHPEIADSWGLYSNHLSSSQGETEESLNRWVDKADSLLVDLIHLMVKDLNIPFTKTSIKKSTYAPKWHTHIESQQNEIRTLLLALLRNERSINLNTTIKGEPK